MSESESNQTEKKFKCDSCDIYCFDTASFESHINGKKHARILFQQTKKEKKEKCGIFVVGMAQTTKKEDLKAFFDTFGKIDSYFIEKENKYAMFYFDDEKHVNVLLEKKTVKFQNTILSIRKREEKNSTKDTKGAASVLDDDYIQNIVKDLNMINFESQLLEIYQKLCVPPQNIHRTHNIIGSNLQYCLWNRFPKCKIWFFGSTVSGLAFKTSDIDIYVQIENRGNVICSPESFPSVCTKITRGILCNSAQFNNVIAIPRARTPIVKFIHTETQLSCDVNFKNMLGVCNSYLLKFLISLDERIFHLMFLVKLWAKIQIISGSGRIPNYGIIMLVVFYLQQGPIPIIPSISSLQTPDCISVFDGWNGGYCTNKNIIPPNRNRLPMIELLKGFFDFWAEFNYDLYVICPLVANALPKYDFIHPKNLPREFFRYKEMISKFRPLEIKKPLTIQDPFQLNHNITSNVSTQMLENFKDLCEIARNIITDSKLNNADLLPSLLVKTYPVSRKCSNSDERHVIILPGNNLSILENYIYKDEPKNVQQLWFKIVNQFVNMFLKQLLLFDVTDKKVIRQSKYPRLFSQSDIHDHDICTENSTTLQCLGYSYPWNIAHALPIYITEFHHNQSILKHEVDYSNSVFRKLTLGKPDESIISFDLILKFKLRPLSAELVFVNENKGNNNFCTVVNFCALKLPDWFKKYLKEVNENGLKSDCDEVTNRIDKKLSKKADNRNEPKEATTDNIQTLKTDHKDNTDKNKIVNEDVAISDIVTINN